MRINSFPGKFEGESLTTQFAYRVAMEDGHDIYSYGCGSSETVVRGPFELIPGEMFDLNGYDVGLTHEERDFITSNVGCIVKESSEGFVTVDWFDEEAAFQDAIDQLNNVVYDEDCELNESENPYD